MTVLFDETMMSLEALTFPKALEILSVSIDATKEAYYESLRQCRPEDSRRLWEEWAELDKNFRMCQQLIDSFVGVCSK